MAAPHVGGGGATPNASNPHAGGGNWEQDAYAQAGTSGQPNVFNPGNFAPAPAPVQQQGGVYSPSSAATGVHQRPAGQQGHPAQSQQQPGSGFFGGGGDANMASAAGKMVAEAGLAQAQSMFAQYVPGAQSLWLSIQMYFQVDNKFVLNRLKTLLFPFAKKQWQRTMTDGFEGRPPAPKLPIADANAPDLYIPVMSLVTYVLVTGLAHGTTTEFTPDILVNVASAGIVTQVLELGLIWLVFMLLSVPRPALLDCLAWCSNKYLGALLSNLVFLLLGQIGFYVTLLYTGAAMAFFLVRTLQGNMAPSPASNKSRNLAVLAVGGLQPLLIWWLACQ